MLHKWAKLIKKWGRYKNLTDNDVKSSCIYRARIVFGIEIQQKTKFLPLSSSLFGQHSTMMRNPLASIAHASYLASAHDRFNKKQNSYLLVLHYLVPAYWILVPVSWSSFNIIFTNACIWNDEIESLLPGFILKYFIIN